MIFILYDFEFNINFSMLSDVSLSFRKILVRSIRESYYDPRRHSGGCKPNDIADHFRFFFLKPMCHRL